MEVTKIEIEADIDSTFDEVKTFVKELGFRFDMKESQWDDMSAHDRTKRIWACYMPRD